MQVKQPHFFSRTINYIILYCSTKTDISFDNEIKVNITTNSNAINMKINDFLESRLRYSNEVVSRVASYLDSKCINSLEELSTLNDDGWTNFSQNLPTVASKIRNEIGKLSEKKSLLGESNAKKTNKSKAELLGDWHKTVRFLFYEAEMFDELSELGYLSEEALTLGLEEQRQSKSFNGGPILEQIKKAFDVFTIKPNDSIILSHGMLMYGPPGTGKTSLINVIIRKAGLKELVKPFASTELNRGIVGETERLIRDIIRRGDTFPYLLCCVAIDEIDAIVPKREGSNSNQRIDSLTQFLTLIGGVDDVKNVYMIGATNRFNKIDEAFLRRLGDKFYVGNLSKDERFKLLEETRNLTKCNVDYAFLSQNEELIKVLTTNFSGAAASALRSYIIQHIEQKQKVISSQISKDTSSAIEQQNGQQTAVLIQTQELIKLIDKCAASFKVKFGGMTIAQLIQSNASTEPGTEVSSTNYLDAIRKSWSKYQEKLDNSSGRVLIDLNHNVLSMQFELKNGDLFELALKEQFEQVQFLTDLIPFIMFLCAHLGIEYVKFIDTNFKILQGAEEKSSTLNLILDCFTDFENYENGL